ncbi:hypothetical protein KKB28_07760 [bacterium]|nr:hypothetical protein [bacterium]
MKANHLYVFVFLALGLGIASTASAEPTIYGIRYGTHTQYDRLVIELSEPVDCRVETIEPEHLRIHLGKLTVSQKFSAAKLPDKMATITYAHASGGGELPFTIDLRLRESASASVMQIEGDPSRIAIDFHPQQAAKPAEEEPEYIPGDRPFPTKFAETSPPPEDIDDAKIHAILAFYFAAAGDSAKAEKEAAIYASLTGIPLEFVSEVQITTPEIIAPGPAHVFVPWLKVDYLIAFLAGLIGYTLALALSILIGSLKKHHPHKQADELMTYAKNIRKAVDKVADAETTATKQKNTPPAQPAPKKPAAEAPLPEPVEVEALKESAAERRAKRVVELSKQGKSVSDIAQELEMSQDEIKLILDLNA